MTLTKFLRMFFYEDEPVYIFGFPPKELPEELKDLPNRIKTSIGELQQNRELQNKLKTINETQGLYFTVNLGGTKKDDITGINAAFCEIDDIPIQDQHDLYDNAPLPPSIRVETKKSVHAYWLMEEDISVEQFQALQYGLMDYFDSDRALNNENRVMRLPFFNHVSFDLGEYIYKPVTIHTFSDTGFNYKELANAYPHFETTEIVEPRKWAIEYENNDADWERLFNEMANRFKGLPGYSVEHGGRLASAKGVCHNGDTNRTLVYSFQTNKIFCRAGCCWDDIRRALGCELPKSKIKSKTIPKVERRKQTSALYQYLSEVAA